MPGTSSLPVAPVSVRANGPECGRDEMENVISLFILDTKMNYQQVIGEYNHLQLMSFLENHGFVFIT